MLLFQELPAPVIQGLGPCFACNFRPAAITADAAAHILPKAKFGIFISTKV